MKASVDGWPWELITPMGGYTHSIVANPASPFPAGTPCFSGTVDWIQKRVNLTGLTGETCRQRDLLLQSALWRGLREPSASSRTVAEKPSHLTVLCRADRRLGTGFALVRKRDR
ncbi:hypothetical protein ACFL6M_04300 [Candidatus Eisenbacteria bacterium]|uniref:Uncharacterized protein n=1 Tax=Eiseniibacteriota bacterium TaxID=2212470 RepID=A0ABV6YKD0_UNCEI